MLCFFTCYKWNICDFALLYEFLRIISDKCSIDTSRPNQPSRLIRKKSVFWIYILNGKRLNKFKFVFSLDNWGTQEFDRSQLLKFHMEHVVNSQEYQKNLSILFESPCHHSIFVRSWCLPKTRVIPIAWILHGIVLLNFRCLQPCVDRQTSLQLILPS